MQYMRLGLVFLVVIFQVAQLLASDFLLRSLMTQEAFMFYFLVPLVAKYA